ncbi:hypothetical protein POPTR_016G003133v4 [Populus trichocarpa]|uniref:Uncharacterized protein n=1 Tax=Populus trichocarpa TaxID=3694 RepID=A0ACC0RSJ1_POPTR|nr:hypothetical protein BDE02_16G003100 [Populus trichocarpa]KAI9379907.1 hypothetical protein POPTR_016G003133v4 [Populus trichocarpa]
MGKQEKYQETDTESESSDDEEDEEPEKWRRHYPSKHRMLLVGEDDFSFSLSLARPFVLLSTWFQLLLIPKGLSLFEVHIT